jgi:PadR family transcriptional regulator PadR
MTGSPQIKDTRPNRRVLVVLLSGASNLSGYPLSRLSGIRPGAVYLALARLERAGWVTGQRQPGVPPGQPARRFYRLTSEGRRGAIELLGLEGL